MFSVLLNYMASEQDFNLLNVIKDTILSSDENLKLFFDTVRDLSIKNRLYIYSELPEELFAWFENSKPHSFRMLSEAANSDTLRPLAIKFLKRSPLQFQSVVFERFHSTASHRLSIYQSFNDFISLSDQAQYEIVRSTFNKGTEYTQDDLDKFQYVLNELGETGFVTSVKLFEPLILAALDKSIIQAGSTLNIPKFNEHPLGEVALRLIENNKKHKPLESLTNLTLLELMNCVVFQILKVSFRRFSRKKKNSNEVYFFTKQHIFKCDDPVIINQCFNSLDTNSIRYLLSSLYKDKIDFSTLDIDQLTTCVQVCPEIRMSDKPANDKDVITK